MARSSRSQARELVLQALYAAEAGDQVADGNIAGILGRESLGQETAAFARSLFDQVREHREWADRVISELAHNWKLERIAVVDRIILQMAMTELRVMADIPVKVVLNEAIELAKLYSTAESYSFINGILDSFVKSFPGAPQV